MKITIKLILISLVLAALSACSTTGKFKIPEGSELYIYERAEPVKLSTEGQVTVSPFFWTAMGFPPRGGIPYRLEKNGKTIKQGRLRAKFRVVSIFWPPLAAIYWPVGLRGDIVYDLVNDVQQ